MLACTMLSVPIAALCVGTRHLPPSHSVQSRGAAVMRELDWTVAGAAQEARRRAIGKGARIGATGGKLMSLNRVLGQSATGATGGELMSLNRVLGQSATLVSREDRFLSVAIPESVTAISGGAFEGCSLLRSVSIPDSVTRIEDRAFADCSSLTSLTIPEGCTSVGDHAFAGCSSLQCVTIPDSVTSIGEAAFENCVALGTIRVRGMVTQAVSFAGSSGRVSRKPSL